MPGHVQRQTGLKLTVLTHTIHAERFNQLLARLNPHSQLNLMQVTELTPATAVMLAAKVKQGEFIAIAGDRIPVSRHARVAFARFLGAPAPFPVGPYVLASLFNCPTYRLFSLRTEGQQQFNSSCFASRFGYHGKTRDALCGTSRSEYAARLERNCLARAVSMV